MHGTLQPIWSDAPRLTSEHTVALAEGCLSNTHKTQLNERGDADFAYANSTGRFRTSVVRQRLGVDLVFRIINTKVRTMDELGLPGHLKLLTRYQNGLILVTGGTGFIGPHQVRYALARGHQVTLFNRGKTNPGLFREVEKLQGDRAVGDYRSLQGRDFDAVIDNPTAIPRWVRQAAETLKGVPVRNSPRMPRGMT